MEQIKEAFQKVRQDIEFLKQECSFLRENMIEICEIIQKLDGQSKERIPTDNAIIQTNNSINPTDTPLFKPLNAQNLHISSGNGGVPTDRQTDRQTNQQTDISQKASVDTIGDAVEMLNSLDNIKKEIRIKFKRLTEKELLVFSVIYQSDEKNDFIDYRIISKKLELSESSIRDYVGKLIKKGIPVEKEKINNKNIRLFISPNLKKIASLSSIIQLRDL